MTLELGFALANLPQIDSSEFVLTDLSLESQLGFLECLKPLKDIEKGKCRGHGFSNSINRNAGRKRNAFTNAEKQFADICASQDLYYVHEHRFNAKDGKNRLHHYKLDFLFPDSRINVEISPDFHWTYKIVAIRDVLKKRALKRAGIRTFVVRVFFRSRKGQCSGRIDVSYARKIVRIIKQSQTSPESLNYWLESV